MTSARCPHCGEALSAPSRLTVELMFSVALSVSELDAFADSLLARGANWERDLEWLYHKAKNRILAKYDSSQSQPNNDNPT